MLRPSMISILGLPHLHIITSMVGCVNCSIDKSCSFFAWAKIRKSTVALFWLKGSSGQLPLVVKLNVVNLDILSSPNSVLIATSIILALASTSSPTIDQCISAWYPALAATPIFVVGGGGNPTTPFTWILSGPNWTTKI